MAENFFDWVLHVSLKAIWHVNRVKLKTKFTAS